MDLYEVLGLQRNASAAAVKQAYYKLALKHHPDKGAQDDDKFKTIAEAHGVLSDVKKKRVYDTKGMLGLRQFEARNQCEVARTKEHAKTEARRQIAEEKKRGAQQNSERIRRKQEEKRALQKEKAEINAREKRLGAPDSCGDRALLGREIRSANTMALEESVQFSDSVTAVTSPQSPETIPEVGNRSVRDSMGTPYVDASAASDEETFADSARTASIFPAAVEESHLAAPEVEASLEEGAPLATITFSSGPTAEPAIVEIDDDFGAPSPEEVEQSVHLEMFAEPPLSQAASHFGGGWHESAAAAESKLLHPSRICLRSR
eukprot:Skav235975  [mRNA]  locus=scaffold592:214264:215220:- [translate_table: standard]